jgi:hypothetical protein
MTFEPRAASIDMASIELRNSPAPAYSSTFKTQQHVRTDSTSNNPYFQSATSTGSPYQADIKGTPTVPDHHDPNHPHYIEPLPKSYDHQPRIPAIRRRIPQKRILIPWILALLFFLTTLWFTSILLGARFLNIMHPTPSLAPAQQINVYVNGDILRGVTETIAVTPTTSIASNSNVAATSTTTSSYTGRLHLAQTSVPELKPDARRARREAGFVTIVREG